MTDALAMPAATSTAASSSRTKLTTQVTVDLHGFHPDQITGYPLESLIEQAWEMGVDRLRLVHGHGPHRPTAGRPVHGNNSGFLGLRIRNELQNPSSAMRKYIGSRVVDQHQPGQTCIKIRRNPNPTRIALDLSVLPKTRHRRDFETQLAWSEHERKLRGMDLSSPDEAA